MDLFWNRFSARCAVSCALLAMFFINTSATEITPLR